jgi:hypothetical protein
MISAIYGLIACHRKIKEKVLQKDLFPLTLLPTLAEKWR